MNITEQLEKVRSRIEETAANHEREIETLSGKIQEAETRGAKAKAQASEAYASQNIKAYHAAKDTIRESEDAAGMFAAKLAEIRKAPQMTNDEYATLGAQIRKEAEAIRVELVKRIEKHIAAIVDVGEEYGEVVVFCNSLLHALQHDIMKDDACVESANGVRTHVDAYEQRLEHFNVIDHTARRVYEAFNGRGMA